VLHPGMLLCRQGDGLTLHPLTLCGQVREEAEAQSEALAGHWRVLSQQLARLAGMALQQRMLVEAAVRAGQLAGEAANLGSSSAARTRLSQLMAEASSEWLRGATAVQIGD